MGGAHRIHARVVADRELVGDDGPRRTLLLDDDRGHGPKDRGFGVAHGHFDRVAAGGEAVAHGQRQEVDPGRERSDGRDGGRVVEVGWARPKIGQRETLGVKRPAAVERDEGAVGGLGGHDAIRPGVGLGSPVGREEDEHGAAEARHEALGARPNSDDVVSQVATGRDRQGRVRRPQREQGHEGCRRRFSQELEPDRLQVDGQLLRARILDRNRQGRLLPQNNSLSAG